MGKRITDKQKKQIIADYIECENCSEVARKYKVCRATVNSIIAEDSKLDEKLQQKKEENTKDILSYLDERNKDLKLFFDYLYTERLNPENNREELSAMSLNQLATVYGVLMDKILKSKEISLKIGTDSETEDTEEAERVVFDES